MREIIRKTYQLTEKDFKHLLDIPKGEKIIGLSTTRDYKISIDVRLN